MSTGRNLPRWILSIAVFLWIIIAIPGQAVIRINGQVWDGNGGPFVRGTVYHIVSNGGSCCLSVPAGRTLTIQRGAVVKIDISINIQGTLIARGADFTSIHDDSIGGDTNNNGGQTFPSRGDWSVIEASGDVLFEDCRFFYGGRGVGKQMVHHRGGAFTMRRCLLEQSASNGIDVSNLESKISDIWMSQLSNGTMISVNG